MAGKTSQENHFQKSGTRWMSSRRMCRAKRQPTREYIRSRNTGTAGGQIRGERQQPPNAGAGILPPKTGPKSSPQTFGGLRPRFAQIHTQSRWSRVPRHRIPTKHVGSLWTPTRIRRNKALREGRNISTGIRVCFLAHRSVRRNWPPICRAPPPCSLVARVRFAALAARSRPRFAVRQRTVD